jgi:predicted metal-dependent phosphoesterase TrpH
MKIDMHLHTRGSFDCLSDPHAVVERSVARGLDMICVTDHNEIGVGQELSRAFPGRVIVGEEVKTAEGVDIIGLFLSELIAKGTPARATCERIRAQGGIVYVPHPFAGGKGGGGRILGAIEDVIDAVEGFNGRIHDPALNSRAVEWARARGLPVGAGSDAHTLHELGRTWVEMPSFDGTPAGFLAALRQGRLHGTPSSHVVHVASTWAKVHKRIFRSN